MSIFRNISNHSTRGYFALQTLFAASALTLGWSVGSFGDGDGALNWALGFCLSVNVIAILVLVYLQRTISLRLEHASIADEEQARIMRTDALTGAAARSHFLMELQDSLGRPLAPKQATLVLVDIDYFKQLNDSFGHPFGDTVLAHVAKEMQDLFPDGVVGRLGGDEFAILVRDCNIRTTAARAHKLAERLRAGIPFDNQTVSISISIGTALAPIHASQAKELMLLADLALYESKASGRGRMTVFDTKLLSDKRHRRFIERELRAAIYLNELELHYQPVIDLDGSPCAVEGLVRWRHPVRGLIPPSEFIPIAEASSLIDTLGAWVFKRACLDVAAFPDCRISINVSGEQLKRDEFIAMLARTLKETGRSANRFVLEITETAATAATPEVLRRLEEARAMGFRVALDDFGTGFCGFNYLKTLPIDVIKIDRSYIQSLGEDAVARVFVSALTQIAGIQNLVIVAEGVETEADMTRARTAGCNRFQGYHVARPAPKEQLAHFFDEASKAA
jgi:diguanylate cyclase (GGDEF)-like protein